MPIPAAVAIGASLLPSLMQLFGGGNKQPNQSPEATQRMMEMFYKMLVTGQIGQSQLNQASLAGNQFQHSLASSLGQSGAGDSRIGQIAGAGAAGMGAMNRQQVLAQLMKMAQGLTQDSMQGQQSSAQFDWQNPSGARAAVGSLGTSLFPLLLSASGQKRTPFMDSPMTGAAQQNWG